jgi:hypothetical protein
MNGLEALLRLERRQGWQDPAVSRYVEGWLAGEVPDEGAHTFESGEGLALDGVTPDRPVRLRGFGGRIRTPIRRC